MLGRGPAGGGRASVLAEPASPGRRGGPGAAARFWSRAGNGGAGRGPLLGSLARGAPGRPEPRWESRREGWLSQGLAAGTRVTRAGGEAGVLSGPLQSRSWPPSGGRPGKVMQEVRQRARAGEPGAGPGRWGNVGSAPGPGAGVGAGKRSGEGGVVGTLPTVDVVEPRSDLSGNSFAFRPQVQRFSGLAALRTSLRSKSPCLLTPPPAGQEWPASLSPPPPCPPCVRRASLPINMITPINIVFHIWSMLRG